MTTQKPRKALHHVDVGGDWLRPAIAYADAIDVRPWPMSTIEVVDAPFCQLLGAKGRILEHVDEDFPPWASILVLRSADSILHVRGHEPLALRPGMMVLLPAHVRHRLVQPPQAALVWSPVDHKDLLSDDEYLSRHAIQLTR